MKLLFIGARLFDDVALYTKNKGINTVLTESNPESPNLNLADSHYIVPRGMDHPKEIAIKEDVDGVVPLIGIDGPLFDVALLKEELERDYGLPVVASPPDAVSISGDKVKTKKFLVENNIKTPEYSLISSDHQQDLNEFPQVLKQSQGQGGKDIKIALSRDDVIDYLEHYSSALAEKFLNGIEISVEILRWNGHSVPLVPVYKGRTTLDCIHPLHKIKKAPLNVENTDTHELNHTIQMIAQNIGELMGVEGTSDLDLILTPADNETFVLEINTRPSGTRYLTAASCDIYPLQEMVDMATGSWSADQVVKRKKEYSALEIPVGDYSSDRNNFGFRKFHGENSWIIHGPKKHQRITIRGKDEENALETAGKLNLDLGNKIKE
ncbi:ATP-grasp domain-containing protein [Methanobacterium formicicum]|uniref:Carbamoyl-phosphate synthase n=1 Tax=Methanobacterium formicicum (strain DSM 3637 / PP1) TaxID=1204725 RepID=K2R1M9_METFP|nr:ATP-grasp domain-containing protein [Methanobacterium formicicum]EKF85152.1 ATP-grasp fold domain-containing protein [Methanobacterium formicicum DSM 3637]